MLRSIRLAVVKVSALFIVVGIGVSASGCWVHGDAHYDRHADHREDHHEDRR